MKALAAAALGALVAGCGSASAVAPPVVGVRVASADQRTGARATAFAFGRDRVLTVAHVLAGGGPVRAGGRRGRVLWADRRLDLALLDVRDTGSSRPSIAQARAGQRVTVRVVRAGAARALGAVVRRRLTVRMHEPDGAVRVRPALELAAAVAPGDSGAPVLDARGRVVGMVFAQASDRDGLAYALDARALRDGPR